MFVDTRSYHGIVDKGYFSHRLYLFPSRGEGRESELRNVFVKLKGASFRYYSGVIGRILGFVLYLFRRAISVRVAGETGYISKKSFVHHILRRVKSSDPEQMHQEYRRHKAGLVYDLEKENRMNRYFSNPDRSRMTHDIGDLIVDCLKEVKQANEIQNHQSALTHRPGNNSGEPDDSETPGRESGSRSRSEELKIDFDIAGYIKMLNSEESSSSSEEYFSGSDSLSIGGVVEFRPKEEIKNFTALPKFDKMWENARLAVAEHKLKEDITEYLNESELENRLTEASLRSTGENPVQLHLEHDEVGEQGKRPMEDEHFYIDTPAYVFAGVLDGHGGPDVARIAAKLYQKYFFEALYFKNDDVFETLNYLTGKIHKKVCEKESNIADQGCTVVLCIIDKKMKLIYTATLGDSEAKMYYKDKHLQMRVVPLSCVRNWGSPEDRQRARNMYPDFEKNWTGILDPKEMRLGGSNASRAIGDSASKAVSQELMISLQPLTEAGYVVLACDGLWDFVRDKQSAALVKNEMEDPNQKEISLAQRLADYALNEGKSGDNVSVITIKVGFTDPKQ